MKVSTGTIIRTICLLLSLVNLGLEMFGKGVIPISDEQVSELITLLFTIGSSVAAFWKNNSFTEEAIKADEYLDELRKNKVGDV